MRITEKMMTTTYNRNLQKNIANLSNSNLKLSSRRQYNHVSEDPATASKAFAIRTQIAASEEHIRTVENAVGELNVNVEQYPKVEIEYVGEPMYVPPSANPSYEE